MNILRIGLDVGSTTAKLVATDSAGNVLFSKYERHHADVAKVITVFLDEIREHCGDSRISLCITGSVGMGISERYSIPFVQEVVAATRFVKEVHPGISTIIDIGGEDAKIVYLEEDGNADLRMNGNCAGGTGAFIDQMALLLGVEIDDMDTLARESERTYPIASRCGVFSKTDVQNLIAKNVGKNDIAASIFHAVAVQTITTLSRGCEITPKILLCGGPLTFIPALRKAFIKYLKLSAEDFVIPENANIIPAWGASLSADPEKAMSAAELTALFSDDKTAADPAHGTRIEPIFDSPEHYERWKAEKALTRIEQVSLGDHSGCVYLGIDSGSTTTKIVVSDDNENIVFTHYTPNGGNPIASIRAGLEKLKKECDEKGVELRLRSSCSTGYGEDLIKAAFGLEGGIIETIAHYVAARKINPKVSFILDIGGQDMKAIFVENGVLSRMDINEACSSGCGSFIETFARSLNYPVETFAHIASLAENPCDLGTRCTVFMNSKVKQVLREGATIGDIAAGLSYSVVKNCLYKVLKLKRTEELGGEIVVQGGTMRNDSVVGALERLTGATVSRSNMPELMGAYGCALYAKSTAENDATVTLDQLLNMAGYTTRQISCHGCENLCHVHKYSFANGNVYYSGNKCEKVFSNRGDSQIKGRNLSAEKYDIIFSRESQHRDGALTIGIPRGLNNFENYPFWHKLLTECGFNVVLSSPSTFHNYEQGVHSVMSDNICFPAKLIHSHIYELIDKKVDRIFFPYVVFEKMDGEKSANSYNCPVISGYSEVIKSAINPPVPVDSPVITFKDDKLLAKGCADYLSSLRVSKKTIKHAVEEALKAQFQYESIICKLNRNVYRESMEEGKLTILLAGRPYHTDPLIQHKLSDMIAGMGVTVITEDIMRDEQTTTFGGAHLVPQWAYINRILRAAQWVAEQGSDVHFVQMTSFGCGPDAFLLDEVKDILRRHGKSLTLLKIDDVNNIGSIKLRVRSVIESLKFGHAAIEGAQPFLTTRVFTEADRQRTILIPYFTDYISPLIPSIIKLSGYNTVTLPESDTESAEIGLIYANNEVCYPATLVVGDMIRALKTGRYDLNNTAVILTQTGGQCRASNYIALIKRGLTEAGFTDVPVLSLALGDGLMNEQSGFQLNWRKTMPITLAAILFGDCISKFYHASAVRETTKGEAKRLRERYLDQAKILIEKQDSAGIYKLLSTAANHFNTVIVEDDTLPRVGIVGEIYLKFNSFAHKRIVEWLVDQRIEVMPPILTDFFMQSFVNRKVRKQTHIERSTLPEFIPDLVYSIVWRKIRQVNKIASQFKYYTPFHDIFSAADSGAEIVSLSAQFGEGWLLPAEIVTYAKAGVNNVISLQPFGCIANHIISKGVEKKIKTLYPRMNLLSLDFDGGVSDVNITNRLMLLTNNLR